MSKKSFLFLLLCAITFSLSAQQTLHHTFVWNSVQRDYIVFEPSYCDSSQPRGMLLCLHGLGQDIDSLDSVAHFAEFVEATGWICVLPQATDALVNFGGTPVNLGSCWNAGITARIYNFSFPLNSGVDDSGFLIALVDSLQHQYCIPTDSTFVSGISMGGFMTHRLLIEHGDHFAAGVPISGTIANTLEHTSITHSGHPNIMHVHGTADDIVSWEGDFHYRNMGISISHIGSSVDSCIDYWVSYNQCSMLPTVDTLADRCNDGLRVVRHTYSGGIDSSKVVLMEVIGGKHALYTDPQVYDVDYLQEIYAFCTGRPTHYPQVNIGQVAESFSAKVFPNPASEWLNVFVQRSVKMRLYNMQGQLMMAQTLTEGANRLNVSALPHGCYYLLLSNGTHTKLLIQ